MMYDCVITTVLLQRVVYTLIKLFLLHLVDTVQRLEEKSETQVRATPAGQEVQL